MKRVIWYGILITGLVLICLPVFAQGLFPGLEIRTMQNWFITFGVGAIFTVIWYVVRRWIAIIDSLQKSVNMLAVDTRLDSQKGAANEMELKILKKRTNKIFDWAHKHDNLHAKCPHCPETDNDLNEPEI